MQSGKAQELVEQKGDTVILISPANLKTINSIIVDRENLKLQVGIYKNIVQSDSLQINALDSTLRYHRAILQKQQDFYVSSISGLEKSIRTEKRKKTILTTVLGGAALVLGILAIAK